MKITVEAEQFTNALAACAAHATKGKDDGHTRTVDMQLIDETGLIVTGSGGGTTGVARVPLNDFSGELGHFALDRADVATITGLFNDPYKQLELTVTASVHQPADVDDKPETVHQVQIRELGTLFGGKQLKLTVPDYTDRDVGALWHHISAALRRPTTKLERTTFSPKDMTLFRAASAAYGEDLTIETADGFGSLIVHCGQLFIGFLHADLRAPEQFTAGRDSWSRILPMNLNVVATGS